MVNNIPVNGWPQLKDLEAVQPTLDRLDKIEAWKRTVKEETFTGDDITIENALALPARSLITEINALQDLHGLPFPYVGGAYKNKFNLANIDTSYFSVNNQTITNTQTDTVNKFELYVQTMNNGSIVDRVGDMIIESTGRKSLSFTLSGTFTHLRFKHNGYSRDLIIALMPWTATGDFTISFDVVGYNPSTAGGLVLSNIQLESGTTATSFAPYSNICPISGRSSVGIVDEGKNLADVSNAEIGTAWNGAPNTARARLVIPCKASTTYTISINGIDNMDLMYVADSSTIPASSAGETFAPSKTFTTKADSAYIIVGFNKTNISQADINALKLQLEEGSTATPYVPYAHSSATIQLGQTVYGAEINWDTGVGTVKTAFKTYTGETDEGWDGDVPTRQYWSTATINNKVKGYIACNEFKGVQVTTWADLQDNQIALHPSVQNNVRVKYSGAADITAFRAFLASNPMQVEYELATPTTIQLTPEQLEMLKGYNHITLSDGYGTIELKALTGANWS